MPKPVLFIDDGGVMNDNARRGPLWQRLLGELFAPMLGGTPEQWAEANRDVAASLWDELSAIASEQVDGDFERLVRANDLAWTRRMCEHVGVPTPADERSLELSRLASDYVTRRVDAAYPGAADAIRVLSGQGYQLHTASGELSIELDGYLVAMGVRQCFGRLYGSDLISAFKAGPRYYERIFADSGVAPADALVIDDKPQALAWAAQCGARTALVGSANGEFAPDLRVARLADLPGVIESLDDRP